MFYLMPDQILKHIDELFFRWFRLFKQGNNGLLVAYLYIWRYSTALSLPDMQATLCLFSWIFCAFFIGVRKVFPGDPLSGHVLFFFFLGVATVFSSSSLVHFAHKKWDFQNCLGDNFPGNALPRVLSDVNLLTEYLAYQRP